MNHSSLSRSDEVVLERRKDDILLYLTTNRMLLGVHIPDLLQAPQHWLKQYYNYCTRIFSVNFQQKVFLGDNGAATEFGACSCPGSS